MYKLEFLPIAKKNIDDIINYISKNLNNKNAAISLSKEFLNGANSILKFPYGLPEYTTSQKLKNKYRYNIIKNFVMFNTIDEKNKIVTIVRVLYKRRNIDDNL